MYACLCIYIYIYIYIHSLLAALRSEAYSRIRVASQSPFPTHSVADVVVTVVLSTRHVVPLLLCHGCPPSPRGRPGPALRGAKGGGWPRLHTSATLPRGCFCFGMHAIQFALGQGPSLKSNTGRYVMPCERERERGTQTSKLQNCEFWIVQHCHVWTADRMAGFQIRTPETYVRGRAFLRRGLLDTGFCKCHVCAEFSYAYFEVCVLESQLNHHFIDQHWLVAESGFGQAPGALRQRGSRERRCPRRVLNVTNVRSNLSK